MASINKVILIGNLGADPEVKHLPTGDAVANLRLATTDTWKNKEGQKQEATEWHRISFFGKQAETLGQYCTKGSSLYIEGSIRTRKYVDKDGVEKYSTEIKGDRFQFLGGRRDSESSPAPQRSSAPSQPNDFDDDIPF